MKVKEGFSLKEIADQWVLVPTSDTDPETMKIITLSSSAALLWKELEKGVDSYDDLANVILNEYEIDYKTALRDSEDFIAQLRDQNMME